MRTKNQTYIFVILLILAVVAFFFTSPYWITGEREMRESNYNKVFEIASWKCKINNAFYDEKTQTMTFDLYMLSTENIIPKLPDISLYNGRKNAEKTPLEFTMQRDRNLDRSDLPQYDDLDTVSVYLNHVTVKNVPKDYWYVSVNFETVTTTQRTQTARTDIFGQTEPTETIIEEKTWEKSVQIDYRIAASKGDAST